MPLPRLLPDQMSAIDTPADNEVLTYDSATGKFEWVDGGSIWVEKAGDTMTGALVINTNSATALLVEQNGVKDNVLVVDTANGRVGAHTAPSYLVDFRGTTTGNLGYSFTPAVNPSVATATYGVDFSPSFSPTTAITNIFGYNASPLLSSSSSNVTNIYGFRAQAFDAASYSGAVTNWIVFAAGTPSLSGSKPTTIYGFRALNQGASGITTAYGLYLDSQSGATNNYAIYTNAGLNRLGDQLLIDGSADRHQFIAEAYSSQTAANRMILVRNSSAVEQWAITGDFVMISKGHRPAVVTKTAGYTATVNDEVIRFTTSATLTLPAATGSGQKYTVIADGCTVTIDGNGSETINNELTQTLYDGDAAILHDVASGKWNIG